MEAVETGFDDVVAALARRWRLILLVATALFVGVVLYAQSLPTTWTATATVAFSPRPNVAVGADTVSLIVPSYVSYVRSPTVESSVGTIYGVTATDLDSEVDASVTPATANVVVAVTSTDRARVAGVANRLADAAVAHAGQDKIVSATVASRAVLPVTPSGPRRRLLEIGGLLAALILGGLAAAVVERGFPRVRSTADVRSAIDLEVVGRLPRSRALRRLGGDPLGDPVVGVAVRALRNRLDVTNRARPVTTVAVCSAGRGEGRSTAAVVLAQAIGRLDARVLLVDGDVVHRRVSTTLAATAGADADLVAVLEGTVAPTAAIVETRHAGLSVLPTRAHVEAGDLFARRLSKVLDDLRAPTGGAGGDDEGANGFDVIVIDTPPLLARDEAGLIARLADGVLVVVENGRRTATLREGAALLAASGARVLGVVLNRASRRSVALGGGT